MMEPRVPTEQKQNSDSCKQKRVFIHRPHPKRRMEMNTYRQTQEGAQAESIQHMPRQAHNERMRHHPEHSKSKQTLRIPFSPSHPSMHHTSIHPHVFLFVQSCSTWVQFLSCSTMKRYLCASG
uniref:Uncharacterized protein n=1 Tax=Physcomitrium patens TaxID=3218 RepID=A0A2K1L6B8_PHYPA|nr:hypothetical protein PHYPA_000010 [Physcomitrium patens]